MSKLVMVWGITVAMCVAIVKLTAIGPVILTISAKHGMGVHTGDSLVLVPLSLASVYTFVAWKNRTKNA